MSRTRDKLCRLHVLLNDYRGIVTMSAYNEEKEYVSNLITRLEVGILTLTHYDIQNLNRLCKRYNITEL